MTRSVWAWVRGRIGGSPPRLPRLMVAVVLLCSLWPAMASAHSERRSHLGRHAGHTVHEVQTSLHRSARSRVADLRLGSGERLQHGSAVVRRLQRGLRRAGYAPGPIDGRYGPLTAAAVERFQANHALRVDGIVGPATRRALRAAPVLAIGSGEAGVHGSPAVARLQRRLRRAGFRPGPVDGRFGPRTEYALKEFQRSRHLAVDGIAGAATLRALSAVGRVSHRPAGPKGVARPPRSAPSRHAAQPKPAPTPRPAPTAAPRAPHLPVVWILIALGAIGLASVTYGGLQPAVRRRTARLVTAVRQRRRPRPAPSPLPEPPSVSFLLYEDNSGGYYWTIVAEDGQVVARSARFASYEEANVAADIVYRGVATASFEDRSGAKPPGDLPTSPTAVDRAEAERWLDQGGGVNRQTVTERATAAGWAWPEGSSSTLGGPRR